MTSPEPFQHWAIVELMGHQMIAGYVQEQTVAGAAMLRVDVPALDDQPGFSRLYGGSAIYSITPVSEEVARLAVARMRPDPVTVYMPELRALPTGVPDVEDDDDPDDAPGAF